MAASSLTHPPDNNTPRRAYVLAAGALIALVLTIALFWWSEIPLGVEGEWTWDRLAQRSLSTADLVSSCVICGVVTAFYVFVVAVGLRRLEHASTTTVFFRLSGICLAGFIWLNSVQRCGPPEYVDAKAMWVLYDPSSSGYFFEACYQIPNTSEFIAGYEQKMSEGDVLHVGTHPPGLFLLHKLLLQLCQRSESVTNFSLWSLPVEYQQAFQLVERTARIHTSPLNRSQRAALWIAVQWTQACAVMALLPIYLLLRTNYCRQTSLLTAAIWPLTPALAVFLPKSDTIYPLIGTTFLVCWIAAQRRSNPLWAIAAGLVALGGLTLSLAILPLILVAGLIAVWQIRTDSQNTPEQSPLSAVLVKQLRRVGWAAVGFGIPLLALQFFANLNLISIWSWNYQNHAAFYEVYDRTYWRWLWINPWETAVGIGLPVTWLIMCSIRELPGRSRSTECLIWWSVWSLLWLSGKTMGEAARLWLVMFPGALWMAAPAIQQESTHMRKLGLWVLVIQASCTLATVTGMSGFHFPGL